MSKYQESDLIFSKLKKSKKSYLSPDLSVERFAKDDIMTSSGDEKELWGFDIDNWEID